MGAIVDSFFVGDRADPWKYVIDLVKDGLAARGLLDRRPERWFRLDTGRTEYVLPEATAQLATESSPEEIERLFDATESARPELWELLEWEIDHTVSARRATDGHYNPYNYSSPP